MKKKKENKERKAESYTGCICHAPVGRHRPCDRGQIWVFWWGPNEIITIHFAIDSLTGVGMAGVKSWLFHMQTANDTALRCCASCDNPAKPDLNQPTPGIEPSLVEREAVPSGPTERNSVYR